MKIALRATPEGLVGHGLSTTEIVHQIALPTAELPHS